MEPARTAVRPLALALVIAAAALWAPSTAHAQGDEGVAFDDLFDLQLQGQVAPGEKPSVTLRARRAVRSLGLELRSGSRTERFAARPLARGKSRTFRWKQDEGRRAWEATAAVRLADGTEGDFRFSLETVVAGPPSLTIARRDIDLEGRCVTAHLSRPLGKVELIVVGASGPPEEITVEAAGGSRSQKACWRRVQHFERLEVRAHDTLGFWAGMQIVEIHIPHEDVNFESGKWEIGSSEAPKLAQTLGRIADALRRHDEVMGIQLFVAGYTDTVGAAADNLTLSRKRAHAIARWFRRKGLRVPIFAQGFGEAALAVPTPDDTDEARNRRALYILSNTPPTGPGFPGGAWQAVR